MPCHFLSPPSKCDYFHNMNHFYFKVCVFKGHRMLATGATLMHTIISWIIPVQLVISICTLCRHVRYYISSFKTIKQRMIFLPLISRRTSPRLTSPKKVAKLRSQRWANHHLHFDNAGKKSFILFEDLGSVQFFFLSGNVTHLKFLSYKAMKI